MARANSLHEHLSIKSIDFGSPRFAGAVFGFQDRNRGRVREDALAAVRVCRRSHALDDTPVEFWFRQVRDSSWPASILIRHLQQFIKRLSFNPGNRIQCPEDQVHKEAASATERRGSNLWARVQLDGNAAASNERSCVQI